MDEPLISPQTRFKGSSMHRKLTTVFATLSLLALSMSAAAKAEQPQVINLQRFRKALWKVHLNVKGKPGDFLLDTGGGVTRYDYGWQPRSTVHEPVHHHIRLGPWSHVAQQT
jgi:hypothetical protein